MDEPSTRQVGVHVLHQNHIPRPNGEAPVLIRGAEPFDLPLARALEIEQSGFIRRYSLTENLVQGCGLSVGHKTERFFLKYELSGGRCGAHAVQENIQHRFDH